MFRLSLFRRYISQVQSKAKVQPLYMSQKYKTIKNAKAKTIHKKSSDQSLGEQISDFTFDVIPAGVAVATIVQILF